MKLDSLLKQLENTRVSFETEDFEAIPETLRGKILIQLLLDYIGNPKIEEKINEIPF